jgi:hypothetical protein
MLKSQSIATFPSECRARGAAKICRLRLLLLTRTVAGFPMIHIGGNRTDFAAALAGTISGTQRSFVEYLAVLSQGKHGIRSRIDKRDLLDALPRHKALVIGKLAARRQF